MDLFYLGIYQGLMIALPTLFLTFLLDLTSISYIYRLFKKRNLASSDEEAYVFNEFGINLVRVK